MDSAASQWNGCMRGPITSHPIGCVWWAGLPRPGKLVEVVGGILGRSRKPTWRDVGLTWRPQLWEAANNPEAAAENSLRPPFFFSPGRVLLLTVNRQHPVLWINTCNANLVYPNVFLSAGKYQFFEWHPFIMKDLSLHNTCSVSSHSATTLRQLTASFLTHIWYSKLAQTLLTLLEKICKNVIKYFVRDCSS